MPNATALRTLSVVLLAVVLAGAACGSGASNSGAESSGGPRLIDPVPDGMEVGAVARGEFSGFFGPDFGNPPVEVYGTAGDDPFTSPTFVVTTTEPGDGERPERSVTEHRQWMATADVGADEGAVDVSGVEGISAREFGPFDGLLKIVWPGDDEVLLLVASSTATVDELQALAEHVSLEDDGEPVVADAAGLDRIGGLGPMADRPNLMSFALSTPDGMQALAVAPVTPAEQVAYRAIMTEDPETAYRTAHSCCHPELLLPPRRLEVDGRAAHVGTASGMFRLLVVRGDPGVVLISGGHRDSPFATVDDFTAVAENLREATTEEVDAIIDRQQKAAEEARYEESERALAAMHSGSEVVGRFEVQGYEVVLSAGTSAPRGTSTPKAAEPGICGMFSDEHGSGPLGCIQRSDWAGTGIGAAAGVGRVSPRGPVLVAADERLASVALETPGSEDSEGGIIPLDLGPDFPSAVGIVFDELGPEDLARRQGDGEDLLDIQRDYDSTAVVARDRSGGELLRSVVRDLPIS